MFYLKYWNLYLKFNMKSIIKTCFSKNDLLKFPSCKFISFSIKFTYLYPDFGKLFTVLKLSVKYSFYQLCIILLNILKKLFICLLGYKYSIGSSLWLNLITTNKINHANN